jgi:hypothetical protein
MPVHIRVGQSDTQLLGLLNSSGVAVAAAF